MVVLLREAGLRVLERSSPRAQTGHGECPAGEGSAARQRLTDSPSVSPSGQEQGTRRFSFASRCRGGILADMLSAISGCCHAVSCPGQAWRIGRQAARRQTASATLV